MLWNGQIGIRLNREAQGEWPKAPMFSIDEYDTTGEEKIRPLFNLVGIDPTMSSWADIDASKPYSQTIDMRTGAMTTHWQTLRGAVIDVTTIVHPTKRIVAERWSFAVKPNEQFSIVAACTDGDLLKDAKDPQGAPWRLGPSEMPVFIQNQTTGAHPDWQFVRSGVRVSAAADDKGQFSFTRVLEFGASPNMGAMLTARLQPNRDHPDGSDGSTTTTSHLQDATNRHPGFDQVLSESKTIWADRWKTDIEIDGPVEDQQAIHSFLFYLRSAIDPKGQMSISPFGLSNSQYNGHVFWDADMWVFPALSLIDPSKAKAIATYRLATRAGALRNAGDWQTPAKPNITELEPEITKADYPKYAWESSVSGIETAPAAMRAEEHINGDVPWMLWQASSLGLIPEDAAHQAIDRAAKYFHKRASLPEAEYVELTNVTSPDEGHTGNNDLYTNLLAQWCANEGSWDRHYIAGQIPPEGIGVAYKLPRDKVSFLTYDDDPLKGYKQAAAVLSIYPLQYPPAEKQAKVMMDRFAGKVVKEGPAMTDSVQALIWARIGENTKAYDSWEKSWREFVKEPQLQFSEKRHKPIAYFTTGAAGCLQTVIYGFLGFRIDSQKQDGALWSTNLALGRILSVRPNLPETWKSVKFKNFTVLGRRYTLIASRPGQSSPGQNPSGGVQVIQGDR